MFLLRMLISLSRLMIMHFYLIHYSFSVINDKSLTLKSPKVTGVILQWSQAISNFYFKRTIPVFVFKWFECMKNNLFFNCQIYYSYWQHFDLIINVFYISLFVYFSFCTMSAYKKLFFKYLLRHLLKDFWFYII